MRIGAHVSVASGLTQSLDYAEKVGAECVQIFAKSPRQWQGKPVDPQLAAAFVLERERRDFGPVFSHTAYLINLSTDDAALRARSVDALADELCRGALLGVSGVVTHIGNDRAADASAAAARVGESIRAAYVAAGNPKVRLLLENTAGAGSSFGSTFAEIGSCIAEAGLDTDRLGICLDTCHAYAQGAPVDTAAGWSEFLDGLEACCGVDRLGLIHANDCLFERGSKRDRHAWIGDGFIGLAGFSAMVSEPRLATVPVVTEMPGDVPDKDIENVGRLKRLRDECSPSHAS